MSNHKRARNSRAGGRQRRLSIRSELRREPDVRKIARAVVALAMAQAEADAQAEREATTELTREEAPRAEPTD